MSTWYRLQATTRLWVASAILLTLSFVSQPRQLHAQCGGTGRLIDVTNSGTEFLLVFMQNDIPERVQDDSGHLAVYIAAQQNPATVTLTSNRYPALHRVFQLNAYQAVSYDLTGDTIQYHGTQRKFDTLSDLWVTSANQADGRVVHVTSTAPIVCYGMNHKHYSSDAFLAFPKSTAATEYRVISYPNSFERDRSCEFAVAAFDEPTVVTITPSAPALNHPAGVPFQLTLHAGECVQVQTDPVVEGLDLTGSEVRADHPVVVYGGHQRAEIPLAFTHDLGSTSRDHLAEAIPPVATWGRAFVLDAFDVDNAGHKGPLGDAVRILALNDQTTVSFNGAVIGTIDHNKWLDTMVHGPTVIETSGPALVSEYAHTAYANQMGDPFMAIVPPVDQTYNDFTFFASADPAFTMNKVVIVTDRVGKLNGGQLTPQTSIYLDNRALDTMFFADIPGKVQGREFSMVTWGVGPGPHTISTRQAPEQGLSILSYGLGPVDSYGYTAGILLKPLRALVGSSTPQSIGRSHSGEITIRNITNESAYIDSMVLTVNNPEDRALGVHVIEKIPNDLYKLYVGGTQTLHITADKSLTGPVRGVLRVYGSTPKWYGLEPVAIPFTLFPEAVADVSDPASLAFSFSNYPNPVTSYTNVTFTLPTRADVTLRVYDELGRVVRTVADATFDAGEANVRFDRLGLGAGVYSFELTSRSLGLTGRRAFVIN